IINLRYSEATLADSANDVKHRWMLRGEKSEGIVENITEKLQLSGEPAARLGSILDDLLGHFKCSTGTIHLLAESGFLELAAQRGLPDVVVSKIATIPVGKGMAGIAEERREPVQVCNLQTDTSGVVRPGYSAKKKE